MSNKKYHHSNNNDMDENINRMTNQSPKIQQNFERNKMKAVFLDRDGVINEYPGDFEYVKSWQFFPDFTAQDLDEAVEKIIIQP